MRRSRNPSPRRLTAALGWALSLALALSSPAALRADAVESYTKGLDAVKTGSWADVARFMEEAVADMPQANRRIRLYGMRFEPYIPHYFLGLARSQLGDCRGALRAWETSVSQGVIRENRSEYSTLQQGRGSCEERLNEAAVEEVEVVEAEEETAPVPQPQPAPPEPSIPDIPEPTGPDPAEASRAVGRAEAAIGEAERQAGLLGQLRTDPNLSDAWDDTPALSGPASEGKRLLARARSRLAAGREGPDLEALEEARSVAVQAQEALSGVIRRAETRRQEILEEQADQAEIARLEAEREAEVERRRADLRDGIAALDEARRRAEQAEQEAKGETPAGPPEALRTAARAYFNGDYWGTLGALSGQDFDDEGVAAQALLFRAAARYALYLLGGEEEESLAETAREDLASCRRLAPDLTPDPRAFSPRFISFFERDE